MSVKKFKVGDKVRVWKGLVVDRQYGEQSFVSDMESMIGRVVTIEDAWSHGYSLEESSYSWTDEMLEPAEKTLENLEKGDLIDCKGGDTKKVLAVFDDCCLLSSISDHDRADGWYTVRELENREWKLVQPEEPAPETIEIGGKKYNKQEFEEAVKDLEPID